MRKPSDGGSERGLFFLTARGWDPVNRKAIPSVRETRFLLVTDIGILTKKSASGGCDVFLMSIQNGRPIANATVEIIGKNGVPLQSETTAADGHAAFRSVEKMERDKTPVVFVARNGDDVAFIPYVRADRLLNFSRFDIDGAQNLSAEDLDAFIFTERGVYRPGDEIHIGLVVKQRNWSGQLAGLPIETEVLDARDLGVHEERPFSRRDARFCRTELPNEQRIADRGVSDQRVSDQKQQAFNFLGLDHGERKRISARSDEDRGAALARGRSWLDQAETSARSDLARQFVRHSRHGSACYRQARSFSCGILFSGTSWIHFF